MPVDSYAGKPRRFALRLTCAGHGRLSTMKKYFYISLVCFCFHGVALGQQTNVVSKKNYPSGKVKALVVRLSPTNSVEREYYESGQLRWALPIGANGKKNGIAKFYYPNGQLESEWQYIDNRSEPLKKYRENGKRKLFVRIKSKLSEVTHKIGNFFVLPSP